MVTGADFKILLFIQKPALSGILTFNATLCKHVAEKNFVKHAHAAKIMTLYKKKMQMEATTNGLWWPFYEDSTRK